MLRDEKVIGTVSTWTDEIYSSRMFRHVEFLLNELSLRIEEFDLFAVAAGPGSFTGLRVGLAAVKGWAEAHRKPIAAISGLEAIAVQSHSGAAVLAPLLDARRGQLYFGIYRRTGAPDEERLELEGEESVMTPDEFIAAVRARKGNSDFTIVTPVPELISSTLSRCETDHAHGGPIPVDEVSAILAPHIGRLGYHRAQRGELTDSLMLDANYVRRSDAELHWKAPTGP